MKYFLIKIMFSFSNGCYHKNKILNQYIFRIEKGEIPCHMGYKFLTLKKKKP